MNIALMVCIVGGLIYLVSRVASEVETATKIGELGRLAFAVGLLAFLLK